MKENLILLALALAFILLGNIKPILRWVFGPSRPTEIVVVNYVSDGDGLVVTRRNGQRWDLRLAGRIDAEEWDQDFGVEAKRYLQQFVKPRDHVSIEIDDIHSSDKGTRLIAFVYTAQGHDLSFELVKAGLAWATKKSPNHYRQAMREARRHGIGLWIQASPIPPWDWRHAG